MDFNVYPYYDDYDADKKFYRVLYRPSFAVQGRELTQTQTILQQQIKKFGDHIFEQGSMVIPGQITYDNTVTFHKMVATYGTAEVDPTDFLGYTIVGEDSGLEGVVINVAPKDDTDPLTFFIKMNNSGTNQITTAFWDGETVQRKDNVIIKAIVQGVLVPDSAIDYTAGEERVYDYSGKAALSSIDAGIYYFNGNFVDVDSQSIVAGKFTPEPSVKIGLRVYESVVTHEDDPSLADNAQNEPNYAAPGADRFSIDMRLETLDIDEDPSTDFIELQQIRFGRVTKEIRISEYSELERTFARRTYDESGSYTVQPFGVEIKEHLRIDGDSKYNDGVYYADQGGDETKVAVEVSPGKAYVQGFEIHKLAPSIVPMDRARDTEGNNNSVTNFLLGNYIEVVECHNIPRIDEFGEIRLYDTGLSTPSAGTTTGIHIGTARVRAIVPVGAVQALTTDTYRIYLFDIQMNESTPGVKYLFQDCNWLYDSNETGSRNFTALPVLVNDACALEDTAYNALIFRLPHENIETLLANGGDTNYDSVRNYYNVGVIASEITLTAQADEVFNAETGSNYMVSNMTTGGALIDPATLTFALSGSPTGKIVTISGFGAGVNNVSVLAPISKQLSSEKTKTLVSSDYNIATPNKIPGVKDYINKADVISVKGVYMSADFITPATELDQDVNDRYIFDTGQKDNYYDRGSITLKSGSPAPTGQLIVVFDYFSHSSGDYFSVDSYVDIDYEEIPSYVSNESGERFFLADCYDFRPRISDSGDSFTLAGASIGDLPRVSSNIRADYEYYLNQINKLYLDRTGEFRISEGVSAIYPKPPTTPETGMVIYDLYVAAYTGNVEDVDPTFKDNRRYTMKDIGKIDKRLSEVEYYTALSLLERETASMDITDDAGLSRFKNGFIVDPFTSHGIGEATHPDYQCAVHPEEGRMRPKFNSESLNMLLNAGESSNYKQTGTCVTLDFTETPVIQQLKGSLHENINPFAVRTFRGEVKFNPDSDNWYDTEKIGTLIVNNDAHYEALKFMADNVPELSGVTWNDWETEWSTSEVTGSSKRKVSENRRDTGISHDDGWLRTTTTKTTTLTTTTAEKRTGVETIPRETTIDRDMGDRTVGINYIPYMRSIPVLIKVEKMKPNTVVYPFFDDKDVKDHCTPARRMMIENKSGSFITKYNEEEIITGNSSGTTAIVLFQNDEYIIVVNVSGNFTAGETITGNTSGTTIDYLSIDTTAAGDPIVTGTAGEVALLFTIPNNADGLQFKTGEREFVLNDQINNTDANQTIASGMFKSLGSMLKQEGTVLSTKTIRFDQEPVEENRIQTSTTTNKSSSSTGWYDPLAETFMNEEEGGCFITSIEVYFQKKDPTLPVTLQVREVVNGYPGSRILPNSEITKNPENVTISSEAPGEPTKFEMDSPVYLRQNTEYCFVLMTDSFDYNVWVGEVGQIDLVSGEMISKQPYNGVLFKSQNASTWSANQNQDMMFTIYKAVFDIDNPADVFIDQDAIPYDVLTSNPIVTQENSDRVRIIHKNHGQSVGSTYRLSGLDAGTSYNGILGSELNLDHTVVDTEIDTFIVVAASVASDTGMTGGDGLLGLRNYQMDVFRPNFTELILPGTRSQWSFQGVTGQSPSGDQTAHQLIQYQKFINMENFRCPIPTTVYNTVEEDDNIAGVKSLKCNCYMTSENRNLSPVLDLVRSNSIIVANRIDSVGTSQYFGVEPDPVGPPVVIGTFYVEPAQDELQINHDDHELGDGAWIRITDFQDTIPDIDTTEINTYSQIRIVDKDNYIVDLPRISTTGYARGDGNSGGGGCYITYSESHYLWTPEIMKEGCSNAARYITKQVTLEDPAEGFRLMFGAVSMQNTNIEIYFRTRTPYDPTPFTDIPWTLISNADLEIPISESLDDFKDHEYTVDLVGDPSSLNPVIEEPFNSISVKLVMKSTDTTQPAIFTDFRLICLT